MRTVSIRAAEPVKVGVLTHVGDAFAQCLTLADLMRWCQSQTPYVHLAEIVTQDEYTHDVVLPFGALFLSFDTT
jgi:hypothetical protein